MNDYEKRMETAARDTNLPDEPNLEQVQEFVMWANEKVIKDESQEL